MEKLQVKRENIFRIPIVRIDGVDNNDFIELDIEDISLPFRCIEALEKRDEILKEAKQMQQEMQRKINKNNQEEVTKEILEMWNQQYNKLREVFDLFLGEGTCNKIFGKKNYATMFDDLMDALTPFLDEFDMSFKNTKIKIEKKYAPKNKGVI